VRGDRERGDPSLPLGATKKEGSGRPKGRIRVTKKGRCSARQKEGVRVNKMEARAYKMGSQWKAHDNEQSLKFNLTFLAVLPLNCIFRCGS
jgi:hypothetical protein